MSVSELGRMLRATLDAVSGDGKEIKHPVPAFELVSIVDGLSQVALTLVPKRAKRELDTELELISGLVAIFAYQSICHHLGLPAPKESTPNERGHELLPAPMRSSRIVSSSSLQPPAAWPEGRLAMIDDPALRDVWEGEV